MKFVVAKFWPGYITTWQIRPYIAGVCARSKRLTYSPTANILQWQHPDRRGAKVNGGGARGRDRAASAASLWRPAGQLKAGRLTGPDQTATQKRVSGVRLIRTRAKLKMQTLAPTARAEVLTKNFGACCIRRTRYAGLFTLASRRRREKKITHLSLVYTLRCHHMLTKRSCECRLL